MAQFHAFHKNRCPAVAEIRRGITEASRGQGHRGTRGLFRRFDGHGRKVFSAVFEADHDRVNTLVLEVTDVHGKKAWSQELRIQNPFYAVTRCTDNLNLLGYSTLTAHPDRHSTFVSRDFEDPGLPTTERTSIVGVDTSGKFVFTPVTTLNVSVRTDTGEQSGGSNEKDNLERKNRPISVISAAIINHSTRPPVDTRFATCRTKKFSYGRPLLSARRPQPDRYRRCLFFSEPYPRNFVTFVMVDTEDYRGGVMLHEINSASKRT